jgi:hypothetical protein
MATVVTATMAERVKDTKDIFMVDIWKGFITASTPESYTRRG